MVSPKSSSKRKRKPTIKQQKAVANLVENGGNVSKAMIDAGYTPATAKTPQKLTDSEYVQALMREVGLTDKDGFQVLKEGLSATKVISATIVNGKNEQGEHESMDDFIDVPDYATRHKYVETLFKVRGLGKVADGTTNFNFINVAKSDADGYGKV